MIGTTHRAISRTAWILCLGSILFASSACKQPAPPMPRSEAHYARLFGRNYRTLVALYLFSYTADPDIRYLGTPLTGPRELPSEVNRQNIGRTIRRMADEGLGDIKIFDVVPAGSTLTIEAETHEVTRFSGIRDSGGYPMGFICKLTYDEKELHGILSEFIQSHKTVAGKEPNQDLNEAIARKMNP